MVTPRGWPLTFVSLGSNIAPRRNMVAMARALVQLSPLVYFGRIVETTPVNVTGNHFLNSVAAISTELPQPVLKQQFNAIEAQLGRDRSDPLSKRKSRPADLDIILRIDSGCEIEWDALPPEPYVRPLLLDLMYHVDLNPPFRAPTFPTTVTLKLDGQPFGQQPIQLQPDLQLAV